MPSTEKVQHEPRTFSCAHGPEQLANQLQPPQWPSTSSVAKGQALHAHHRGVVLPARAVGIAMVEVLLLLLR